MNFLRVVIFVVVSFILAACQTKSIKLNARFPAVNQEAAAHRNVAVLKFEGRYGDVFSAELGSQLSSANFDGLPYFNLTSGDLITSTANVRSTSASDKYLTKGLKTARTLKVDGIYLGTVGKLDIDTTSKSEERTECTNYKKLFKCEDGAERKYNVTCYRKEANMSVNVQLINSSSGQVAYSETYQDDNVSKYCSDEGSERSDQEMANRIIYSIASRIITDVAPYNGILEVSLKTDTKDISKKNVERFKGAVEFAKNNQMARACGIWGDLASSPEDSQSISLMFNRGICAEWRASYVDAVRIYNKINSLLIKPDKQLEEARQRAMQMAERTKVLNS